MKRKRTAAFVIACNIGVGLLTPVYASGDPIVINFGEKLTAQEQNGYTPLKTSDSDDAYDYYTKAKAELPDEVPVLNSFEVSAENLFFVATDGNDTNDGSMASPLATIGEAVKRAAEVSGSSVIYLREGEHYISEALSIEHNDENSALFISAYNGENASITANKSIPISKAKKVTRENTDLVTYSRINDNAVSNLYYISYEDMGMSKIPYESVFYMNDVAMYPSRYPNQGSDTVDSVIKDGSYINSEGFTRTGLPMEWKSQDEHPFTWKDTGDIHIFGRIANEWSLTDGVIWFDKQEKTINSTSGSLTTNYCPVTTQFWNSIASTYYYANIFEELDTKGEWFADKSTERFYFYLSDDTDVNSTSVNYKQLDGYAMSITNSQNVVIDGIELKNVDSGINITESSDVVVQNCKINNTNSTAVKMYNTTKCGILNSDIRNSQKGYAVSITQSDERTSELVPRRNFVQNSYIGNVDQAIQISSTGNICSHNLMENTKYSSMNVFGAENIIERNEFSGVSNKITDSGGIYIGGNIMNRAHTVRYNYFHDSKPDLQNARAIYCDDCSDMSWIYGNVIKNFSYGIFLHSGDDHVVENNVVINAGTYIRNSQDYAAHEKLMRDYFFRESPQFVVGYKDETNTTWHTRYEGILQEKYDAVFEARTAYNSTTGMYDKIQELLTSKTPSLSWLLAKDNVKKAAYLVADTGCYYKNNTYAAPDKKYSWGYGASDYGRDNNGDSKLTVVDSNGYDYSSLVQNMGLLNTEVRSAEAPKIYMENDKEIRADEFTGISWSTASNCSYYKTEIATDESFENIVISYNTANNEYPVYKYVYDSTNKTNNKVKTSDYDFVTDTPYFVRVTAVSLAKCTGESSDVSSVVKFTLRNELESKRDKAESEVYFGKTSLKIGLKGSLPDYLLNDSDRQVTLVMYEEGDAVSETASIKHIAQINPDEKGKFEYIFNEDITDKTRIRVKLGTEDITDKVFKGNMSEVTEVTFTNDIGVVEAGKAVTAAAKINNMLGVTDKCEIIVASYDNDGRLVGCQTVKSKDIALGETTELSNVYTIPEGAKTIKAFIWNVADMKPLD